MQVVMNKCFLLNPKKIWRRSVLSFSRKTQKSTLYFQKMMSPSRRLDYSNNQSNVNRLQVSSRLSETVL